MSAFEVRFNGCGTFVLRGELDLATVRLLNVALADAVADGGMITLDMSAVTLMDSSGAHALVDAATRLPLGSLTVYGPQRQVRQVFRILGIEHAPNLSFFPSIVSEGGHIRAQVP